MGLNHVAYHGNKNCNEDWLNGYFQAKKDLTVRFDRALASFRSKERQIFVEIKQQIISLVLQRTVSRIQETFKSQERSSALINETIDKLKGDLL